jgi:hypothetical protein
MDFNAASVFPPAFEESELYHAYCILDHCILFIPLLFNFPPFVRFKNPAQE